MNIQELEYYAMNLSPDVTDDVTVDEVEALLDELNIELPIDS